MLTSTCLTSLDDARDYVRQFLDALHSQFEWGYDRLFLFGFSQGAAVAFHVAMTLPPRVRLGGVVLVAGGATAGPHTSAYSSSEEGAIATPMLLLAGDRDMTFPLAMARETQQMYTDRFSTGSRFQIETVVGKQHGMLASEREMRSVMGFFSEHLTLRDAALEAHGDVIELQT